MISQPVGERTTIHLSGSNSKNNFHLLILTRRNLVPIEHQKRFQRGMTSTLVTVHKRMILNDRISQSRCFVHSSKVQVFLPPSNNALCQTFVKVGILAQNTLKRLL